MNDTPSQVNALRKAVELAKEEVTEAQNALKGASEQKSIINKIPKRKAGGGKEAKRVANQQYQQARNDLKEKTLHLDKAQSNLINAERVHSLEPSGDKPLVSYCDVDTENDVDKESNVDKANDLGKEAVSIERQMEGGHTASEDQDTQPHLDEMLPNLTSSEGGPYRGGRSDGSNKQGHGFGKAVVERQGTSEYSLSQMLPGEQCTHPDEMPPNHAAPEGAPVPSVSLESAESPDLGEADSSAKGPEEDLYVSKSEGVSEKRPREDTETPNSPLKKKRVTRGSQLVSLKKTEVLEDRPTESSAVKIPLPVSEIEDEWAAFQSDPPSDTDEEKEKERVANAKKSKHLNLTKEDKGMYRVMEPDAKKAYKEKALTAIHQYLQTGKSIDFGIRRMARMDPTFLPQAATTSRELAIHFLTTKEDNIMCGYHSFKNKVSYVRDGWGKPGMKVRGIPGKRKVATSEEKTPNLPEGLGNCGCRIQDILLEFALSKLISISGFVDGERQSEMMSFHDYMEPRDRSFIFQAICLMVPDLSLNDFYTHGEAMKHNLRIAKKRVDYWVRTLNDSSHTECEHPELTEMQPREAELRK